MKRFLDSSVAILVFISGIRSSFADWADDVGYTRLRAELGASAPTGAGVDVTQVEAPVAAGVYAPVAGPGTGTVSGAGSFLGKTFTLKSGASGESFHAREVGWDFYGIDTGFGIYGIGGGVTTIDVYEANNWVGSGGIGPAFGPPVTESRKIQNHSWIGSPSPGSGEEADYNELLRRMDYAVNRDGFLAVVGANNGNSTVVPVLLGTAFNVISVGLTSGNHSHGITLPDYDVPGRQKPEIVAPSTFTSFATATVSGAGACLRQVATTTNGRRNQTLRAVMFAGATKEEFSGWTRTTTQPIDSTFGFGELNIYNSFKILNTSEQTKNANVTLQGWDYTSVATAATADYLLTIPVAQHGASLSAAMVWNRAVTFSSPSTFDHSTLANLSLKLYRTPGTPGTLVDSSDSAVDNLEHIWQPALLSGTYRLRVTGDASLASATNYTLAWRVNDPISTPTIAPVGTFDEGQPATLNFIHLVPGQAYELQTSSDLNAWATIHSFTATTMTDSHSFTVPAGSRRFYQLKWTIP